MAEEQDDDRTVEELVRELRAARLGVCDRAADELEQLLKDYEGSEEESGRAHDEVSRLVTAVLEAWTTGDHRVLEPLIATGADGLPVVDLSVATVFDSERKGQEIERLRKRVAALETELNLLHQVALT
jgi:hypothetical protein